MAQRPTVDWNKLPAATKILLVAGLLYFIDLFLPWYKYSVTGHGLGTASGWHGALGVLCGILVILILLIETLTVMNVPVNIGTDVMRNQVEAGAAGLLLLLTILHVFIKPGTGGIPFLHVGWELWAWIGLIISIVVAYGGYMRWQEASVTPAAPGQAGGGGGFAP